MSPAADLLMSDVSAAAVDQIISQPMLWATISFAHFSMGFIGFHAWFTFPMVKQPARGFVVAYGVLQIVQTCWSPGSLAWLSLDGVWDLLCPVVGMSLAWAWAMRGVQR